MKLFLARHTETNYNLLKLCNANPSVDVHLSEKGILQAKKLAELLKNSDFEIIYISELPRTRETASYVNEFHNLDMIVDARINDNKTGFESRPVSDWQQAISSSNNKWNARFNHGESLKEAADRASEFIDDLRNKNYNSVLVVSHGFITQAIFAKIENKTLDEVSEFNLPQGTYSEFEI